MSKELKLFLDIHNSLEAALRFDGSDLAGIMEEYLGNMKRKVYENFLSDEDKIKLASIETTTVGLLDYIR